MHKGRFAYRARGFCWWCSFLLLLFVFFLAWLAFRWPVGLAARWKKTNGGPRRQCCQTDRRRPSDRIVFERHDDLPRITYTHSLTHTRTHTHTRTDLHRVCVGRWWSLTWFSFIDGGDCDWLRSMAFFLFFFSFDRRRNDVESPSLRRAKTKYSLLSASISRYSQLLSLLITMLCHTVHSHSYYWLQYYWLWLH